MAKSETTLIRGLVSDLSGEGWGVVYSQEGRTYFVKGAWPGEEVLFEVISEKKNFAEAVVKDIVKAHPLRRKDLPCKYHGMSQEGHCGGCPWLFMEYSAQLEAKVKRLEYLIKKNKIDTVDNYLKAIIGSPQEFAFRNRAQVKCTESELGFVSMGSKNLVDVEFCAMLNEKMQKNYSTLRSRLPNKEWKPEAPFHWNFIDFDERQDNDFPINKRRPFLQANNSQNENMKKWLRSHLEGKELSKKKVLELYCGAGNFTEVLAECSQKVLALELSEQALKELKEKNIARTESKVFNLSSAQDFEKLSNEFGKDWDLLFLDPPREGALGFEKALEKMPKIKKIIYISCDARTWARDVGRLKNFRLVELQPLDQFPHTPHLEILTILERKEASS